MKGNYATLGRLTAIILSNHSLFHVQYRVGRKYYDVHLLPNCGDWARSARSAEWLHSRPGATDRYGLARSRDLIYLYPERHSQHNIHMGWSISTTNIHRRHEESGRLPQGFIRFDGG